MLDEKFHFPGIIKGRLLDNYLAKGWYRTGCVIFTTHFLSPGNDDRHYRVYWLRYIVSKVQLNGKKRKIAAMNKGFTATCRPFELTAEVDALHKRYAANTKFGACNNLETVLMDVNNDIFDSYMVEVRDNGKLIAAGVFDRGQYAIEGIINFYDPDYKKHSLGKYLILLKYSFCRQNNIPFYYPGYYMPEHPLFDYKLFLDNEATEVYLPEEDKWVPLSEFKHHPALAE